jgi:hypothetical protein
MEQLSVFHNSGLYVCLEQNLYDGTLDGLLAKCAAEAASERCRRAACGCVWKAYERAREVARFVSAGRTVVVKES